MIGADTSFVIDILRGDTAAIEFVKKHESDIVFCETSLFEVLSGNVSSKEREQIIALYSQTNCYVFDRAATLQAATMRTSLRKKGITLPSLDSQIIGTFLANGVKKIVTRDSKHFKESPMSVLSY